MTTNALQILFEFEDGSVRRLTGFPANKWLDDINKLCQSETCIDLKIDFTKYKWDIIITKKPSKKAVIKKKIAKKKKIVKKIIKKEEPKKTVSKSQTHYPDIWGE